MLKCCFDLFAIEITNGGVTKASILRGFSELHPDKEFITKRMKQIRWNLYINNDDGSERPSTIIKDNCVGGCMKEGMIVEPRSEAVTFLSIPIVCS